MKDKLSSLLMIPLFLILSFSLTVQASASTFMYGGDRLVDLQQDDGGWDWPLDDGDVNSY